MLIKGAIVLIQTLISKISSKLFNVNDKIISSDPIELLDISIKKHELDLEEKEKRFNSFKGKLQGLKRELASKESTRDSIKSRLLVCERKNDIEGLSQGRNIFNKISNEIEVLQSNISNSETTLKEIEEILDQKRNYISQLKSEKNHLSTQYELAKAKNDLMNFKKEFKNGTNSSNPYIKKAYELIDEVNASNESSNKKTHELFKDF